MAIAFRQVTVPWTIESLLVKYLHRKGWSTWKARTEKKNVPSDYHLASEFAERAKVFHRKAVAPGRRVSYGQGKPLDDLLLSGLLPPEFVVLPSEHREAHEKALRQLCAIYWFCCYRYRGGLFKILPTVVCDKLIHAWNVIGELEAGWDSLQFVQSANKERLRRLEAPPPVADVFTDLKWKAKQKAADQTLFMQQLDIIAASNGNLSWAPYNAFVCKVCRRDVDGSNVKEVLFKAAFHRHVEGEQPMAKEPKGDPVPVRL